MVHGPGGIILCMAVNPMANYHKLLAGAHFGEKCLNAFRIILQVLMFVSPLTRVT